MDASILGIYGEFGVGKVPSFVLAIHGTAPDSLCGPEDYPLGHTDARPSPKVLRYLSRPLRRRGQRTGSFFRERP